MKAVLPLLAKVDQLSTLAEKISEECYRMTVAGSGVSQDLAQLFIGIETECNNLSISCPTFRVNDTTLNDVDEINDYINNPTCNWVMIIGKDSIAEKLTDGTISTESRDNLFYFGEDAALKWVSNIDPFATSNSELSPSFDKEVIVWINNSDLSFGGKRISFLPVGTKEVNNDSLAAEFSLEHTEVSELVKINASELIKIRPDFFVVKWGDSSSSLAQSVVILAIKSLVACIGCELKKSENDYYVTFKGTKVLVGKLESDCKVDLISLQNKLIRVVRWIYSERKETRQQLVMDRLSLDMSNTKNFYDELNECISDALQQSQDSYAFVILDRKDAYHKEMRELLKDMRSQADMYAGKIRDIVNNITRDMLGVFAFVGYSFLGKFDKANLAELIGSHELSLLVRFLSGYLVLSCFMQLIIHLRDAYLTSDESVKWLRVLQRYTSREENTESFLQPIEKRKITLYWTLGAMTGIYLVLAVSIYKLPLIVLYLLSLK